MPPLSRNMPAAPLAIVCCDNLPDNGEVTGRLVTGLAALADPGLATWILQNVSFVTTMVDRITPLISSVVNGRTLASR